MDDPFVVHTKKNKILAPKFQIGDPVFFRQKESKVRAIAYYEGLGYFCYWIHGVGHDIPEDELSVQEF